MLAMGTWGPGIFSDDEACDVRDVYRTLLGDAVRDDQAEHDALEAFKDSHGYVRPAVWLALAATQSRLGRLSASVKDQALAIIDDGRDLAEWQDAPAAEQRKRAAAVNKLKTQLVGPQPERRKVRSEWKYRTSLDSGDVLAAETPSGDVRVLRVVQVRRDPRSGDWVLVELLAYRDSGTPEPATIERLPAAVKTSPGAHREHRWLVANNHSYEPDWHAAGFALVGRIAARPGDAGALEALEAEAEAQIDAHLDGRGPDGEPGDLLDLSAELPFSVWGQLQARLAEAEAGDSASRHPLLPH